MFSGLENGFLEQEYIILGLSDGRICLARQFITVKKCNLLLSELLPCEGELAREARLRGYKPSKQIKV